MVTTDGGIDSGATTVARTSSSASISAAGGACRLIMPAFAIQASRSYSILEMVTGGRTLDWLMLSSFEFAAQHSAAAGVARAWGSDALRAQCGGGRWGGVRVP